MSTFRAMCSAVVLLAALPMCGLAAGWSTNAWPSQAHPFQAKTQIEEAYAALIERQYAINDTYRTPVICTNLMQAQSYMDTLRGALASAIPYFIDIDNVPDYSALSSLYPTNIPTPPHYTVTGLLWALKLPTNYFGATGYSGMPMSLSGLGAHTNDTSVPYPHGVTNAFTAKGGTNFPAGRTKWYDSDYGINAITSIVAKLQKTEYHLPSETYDSFGVWRPHEWYGANAPWSASTYADACVVASNDWHEVTNLQSTFIGNVIGPYKLFGVIVYWIGQLLNQEAYPAIKNSSPWYSDFPTTKTCSVTYYVHASTNNLSPEDREIVFDTFEATGLSENKFSAWETVTYSGGRTSGMVRSTISIGSTNRPMPWAEESFPPDPAPYKTRGLTYCIRSIVDWRPGFTYY